MANMMTDRDEPIYINCMVQAKVPRPDVSIESGDSAAQDLSRLTIQSQTSKRLSGDFELSSKIGTGSCGAEDCCNVAPCDLDPQTGSPEPSGGSSSGIGPEISSTDRGNIHSCSSKESDPIYENIRHPETTEKSESNSSFRSSLLSGTPVRVKYDPPNSEPPSSVQTNSTMGYRPRLKKYRGIRMTSTLLSDPPMCHSTPISLDLQSRSVLATSFMPTLPEESIIPTAWWCCYPFGIFEMCLKSCCKDCNCSRRRSS